MRATDVVTAFAPGLLASGLEWMIAGGVAAIVYGEPRVTLDILHQQGASIRHLHDIRSTLRVLGESVDTTELRTEASDLGLDMQWREMEDLSD